MSSDFKSYYVVYATLFNTISGVDFEKKFFESLMLFISETELFPLNSALSSAVNILICNQLLT